MATGGVEVLMVNFKHGISQAGRIIAVLSQFAHAFLTQNAFFMAESLP
jgi:hypothetical protein